MKTEVFICEKCGLVLEEKEMDLTYLGHSFHTRQLCCPGCGQAFIPEDMVRGRIAQVEKELEDK